MKIDYRNIPRIPRKLKKQMKKENRYTTKTDYAENYEEMISMIRVNEQHHRQMNLYRVIYWIVITGIVALISYLYNHYNQLTFDLFIRLCVVWFFIGWIIEFWVDDFIWKRKYKKQK